MRDLVFKKPIKSSRVLGQLAQANQLAWFESLQAIVRSPGIVQRVLQDSLTALAEQRTSPAVQFAIRKDAARRATGQPMTGMEFLLTEMWRGMRVEFLVEPLSKALCRDIASLFRIASACIGQPLGEVFNATEALRRAIDLSDVVARTDGDALFLDGECFAPNDIRAVWHEYVVGQQGLLGLSSQDRLRTWPQWVRSNASKAVAFIVLSILALYIQVFWLHLARGTFADPETIARQLTHFRKAGLHEVRKTVSEQPRAVVNVGSTWVHRRHRCRSSRVARLGYPRSVKILRYWKKKQWAKIEWINEEGELRVGWILGRYLTAVADNRERGQGTANIQYPTGLPAVAGNFQ